MLDLPGPNPQLSSEIKWIWITPLHFSCACWYGEREVIIISYSTATCCSILLVYMTSLHIQILGCKLNFEPFLKNREDSTHHNKADYLFHVGRGTEKKSSYKPVAAGQRKREQNTESLAAAQQTL